MPKSFILEKKVNKVRRHFIMAILTEKDKAFQTIDDICTHLGNDYRVKP